MDFTRIETWFQTVTIRTAFRTFIYVILFPFVWNWRLITSEGEKTIKSFGRWMWFCSGLLVYLIISIVSIAAFWNLQITILVILIGYFGIFPYLKLWDVLTSPFRFLAREFKAAEESKSKRKS